MNTQTERLIKECKVSQLKSLTTMIIDLEFFNKKLEALKEKEIRKELAEEREKITTVIVDDRDQDKVKKLTEELEKLPAKDSKKINKLKKDIIEMEEERVPCADEGTKIEIKEREDKLNEIDVKEKRKIEIVTKIQEEEAKLIIEDKSDIERIDQIEKDLGRVATCKKEIDKYTILISDVKFYLKMIDTNLSDAIINQIDGLPEIIYDDNNNINDVG